ncbi:hypothetical protein [Pararhizobium sp. DWP1-1-3]|uniref:hypothetical protein n=1 Tax=Pararhizobium sp. DWP1-1-3 TaxID=2804652 RepID=UPI003CF176AB
MLEQPEAPALLQSRRMLVVERKLVRNHGHFQTQIWALQRLLPNYSLHLLAGETYDDFLGPAAGKFSDNAVRLTKLATRAKYGNTLQKLAACLTMAANGTFFKHRASPLADTLEETCERLGLNRDDLVIIPTADLNMLEAALALIDNKKDTAPKFCLRFLSPDFGEPDDGIRKRRLDVASRVRTDRLALYSETEELAGYVRERFGLAIQPYFYLPCSVELTAIRSRGIGGRGAFRVGVFGAPRSDKGSHRLAGIVEATAKANRGNFAEIEFVVQGSENDFERGAYKGLTGFDPGDGKVQVEMHSARMPPDEFLALFQSVDAVLLPYDVSVYGLQGSGIVQDAVAARKLIIHTDKMSMAELLAHGNARSATTDEEFAHQIITSAQIGEAELEAATEQAFAHFQRGQTEHPIFHGGAERAW